MSNDQARDDHPRINMNWMCHQLPTAGNGNSTDNGKGNQCQSSTGEMRAGRIVTGQGQAQSGNMHTSNGSGSIFTSDPINSLQFQGIVTSNNTQTNPMAMHGSIFADGDLPTCQVKTGESLSTTLSSLPSIKSSFLYNENKPEHRVLGIRQLAADKQSNSFSPNGRVYGNNNILRNSKNMMSSLSSSNVHNRSHSEPPLNFFTTAGEESCCGANTNTPTLANQRQSDGSNNYKPFGLNDMLGGSSGGGSGRNRSHSEPLLNLFDESTMSGEGPNVSDANETADAWLGSTTVGWSSPPPKDKTSDRQANSVPFLETRKICGGQTEISRTKCNRTSCAKVKRSRSADPMEMFGNHRNGSEKPKRRRSAPMLSQDIFDDIFDEPELHASRTDDFAPLVVAAPQSPQGSLDLISMLLGVENENSSKTNNDDQIPRSTRQIASMKPEETIQQRPDYESIYHAMHQTKTNFQSTSQQNLPITSSSLTREQFPSSNSNMDMFERQRVMDSVAKQPIYATDNQSQSPSHLSIDNSDDLTLVLSAVKETQTNLRTLQPLVIQLGDPKAMEDISTAFKMTASSSQFVMASDLSSAYSSLNDAWATIKKLEDRLVQRPSQLEQQILPQAELEGAPMPNNPSEMRRTNSLQNTMVLCNNTFIPISEAEEREQEVKTQNLPSKDNAKAKMEKECLLLEDLPPPSPSPEIIMKRLKVLMDRTQLSQKQLQVRTILTLL